MGNGVSTFSRLFSYLRTIQNILMALLAGSKVSDRCPLGYLFYFSPFFIFPLLIIPFISSPEPKAASEGEFIVYQSSWRPCVSLCVHTFKHEYLHNQRADCNQFSSKALLGWEKGCIRFWARSDQNSMATDSSHRVIMGENVVNTLASSCLIGSS